MVRGDGLKRPIAILVGVDCFIGFFIAACVAASIAVIVEVTLIRAS